MLALTILQVECDFQCNNMATFSNALLFEEIFSHLYYLVRYLLVKNGEIRGKQIDTVVSEADCSFDEYCLIIKA